LDFSLVLNNPTTNPDHTVPANWRAGATVGGNPAAIDGIQPPSNPSGDDDGDGIPNLVEHVMGDTRLEISPVEDYSDDPEPELKTYLFVRIPRRPEADGYLLSAETSPNLQQWTPGGLRYIATEYGGPAPIQIWRTDAAVLPGSQPFFLRVRFSLP
jgi:hypothetical protein